MVKIRLRKLPETNNLATKLLLFKLLLWEMNMNLIRRLKLLELNTSLSKSKLFKLMLDKFKRNNRDLKTSEISGNQVNLSTRIYTNCSTKSLMNSTTLLSFLFVTSFTSMKSVSRNLSEGNKKFLRLSSTISKLVLTPTNSLPSWTLLTSMLMMSSIYSRSSSISISTTMVC